MTARLNALDRLARLLSVIPWVAGHSDGVLIDDVVRRYAYPRPQLIEDLRDVVFFVGVHPFTPDALIEVELGDDRVRIRYADWFARPLRLTASDAARLLTAGRSVLAATGGQAHGEELGDDPDEAGAVSPLLRALTKLGTTIGEGAAEAVDVRLGRATEDALDLLRDAIAERRQVDMEYYTYGRDELTSRRVEPAHLFSDQGHWYVRGWCHRAEGERVFRLDRIRTIAITADPTTRSTLGTGIAFEASDDDPRVTLRLGPDARWVAEQYPVDDSHPDGDHLIVTLPVATEPWLERLLLRLGPSASIHASDPRLGSDLRARAADRILRRYRTDDEAGAPSPTGRVQP